MTDGWELMRIKGIPLRIHPSWFLILLLFTWTSQGQVVKASTSTLPFWTSWALGLITALLLFLSVLLHELGHSLVALREGVKVHSITLFLLGGVAKVEKECSTPMSALRVAAAGPLVSLIIALILLNAVNGASEISPLLANLLGQIGSLNLILAIFNLLPGLPLDGGLILKALVWHWTGSQRKGVQVATSTGRLLSIFAVFLGILISFRSGGLGGLWLVMLGWFGLSASRSQSQLLALQNVLSELKVSDANIRRLRVLEEDQPLRTVSQLRLSKKENDIPAEWIFVCRSGRWVGYVTDQPLKDLPVQHWDKELVSDHIRPLSELPSIGQKTPLWKAVIELEKSSEGKLLVFNLAGLPSGILDRTNIGQVVLKRLGLEVPPALVQVAKSQNKYPLGIALPRVVEGMLSAGIVDLKD